jgi:hypothetical protein
MWKALAVTPGVILAVGLLLPFGAGVVTHRAIAQTQPTQHMPSQPGLMPRGQMPHGAMGSGGRHPMDLQAGQPRLPGQDAFGAIAEIAGLLDADPETDWSRVDLERLRQHLIDMNEVVLRSEVKPSPIPGGLVMEITGTGRTERAIRAMVIPHATELDRLPDLTARAEAIPGGVRLTVTSRQPDDPKAVARVRGLGFIGLLTLGAHHGPHHLAMAKGESLPGHSH